MVSIRRGATRFAAVTAVTSALLLSGAAASTATGSDAETRFKNAYASSANTFLKGVKGKPVLVTTTSLPSTLYVAADGSWQETRPSSRDESVTVTTVCKPPKGGTSTCWNKIGDAPWVSVSLPPVNLKQMLLGSSWYDQIVYPVEDGTNVAVAVKGSRIHANGTLDGYDGPSPFTVTVSRSAKRFTVTADTGNGATPVITAKVVPPRDIKFPN